MRSLGDIIGRGQRVCEGNGDVCSDNGIFRRCNLGNVIVKVDRWVM
jgi:hypothetical protein